MDHVEYVHTVGMTDETVERYLEDRETAVLALAAENVSYAIPVAFHYEDGAIYVRLGDDGSSQKMQYVETTETACLTLYDVESPDTSWSVLVTGPLTRITADDTRWDDEAAFNETFSRLRIFDEVVEDVELEVYELTPETVTGRRT